MCNYVYRCNDGIIILNYPRETNIIPRVCFKSGSKRQNRQRYNYQKIAQKNAKLLALKIEKGNQRIQEYSRSWKPQGNRFSPTASKWEPSPAFTFTLASDIMSNF